MVAGNEAISRAAATNLRAQIEARLQNYDKGKTTRSVWLKLAGRVCL